MSNIHLKDFQEKLEGKSWETFFEYIDKSGPSTANDVDESDIILEKDFGALSPISASSLCRSKSSSVATLPYKKASCYGSCPIEETESLKIVKCTICGLIVKVVGFMHHMRLRHGYIPSTPSSGSSSDDDCQDFLLSPPHLPTHTSSNQLTLSAAEENEQLSKTLNDSSSILSTSNVGTEIGSRICSPPYYVEHCKDLVMVISKRTPIKNSNKKQLPGSTEKSPNQSSTFISTENYHTVKHRKRKSRKKEKQTSLKAVQDDASGVDLFINGSQLISPNRSEVNDQSLFENRLSAVDQPLGIDESSLSSVDASGFSLVLVSPKETKNRNCKLKKELKPEIITLKQQQKTIVKEDDVNIPSSSTAIQVNCLKNVSKSKNFRRKTKNSRQKIASKKDLIKEKSISPQLSKFCDEKSNLLELSQTDFASRVPDFHAQVKQCLSGDVFSNAEYRKSILMELDAKNIINSRNNFMSSNLLCRNNKHVSFSLPLSPLPESGSSASSISDELGAALSSTLIANSTTTPFLKEIELHTRSPIMDLKTKEMRKFLLQSTKNKEIEKLLPEEMFVEQNESTQKSLFKDLINEDSIASTSKSKITPFFLSNQNETNSNRVSESNLFCLKVNDNIINPTLRRLIKLKKNDLSIESSPASESTLITKNYNSSLIGRSIVEGTTKFISVNPKDLLNKKVKIIPNIMPIALSKSPNTDGNFINEKSDLSIDLDDECITNQELLNAAKSYAQTLSEKMPNIGFSQSSQQSNIKDSLTNGLRQPSNNNQIVNKLHSTNGSSLYYQKTFVDNVEQRHQRIMMMRAAQATASLLGPIKTENEIEADRIKNSSVGVVKDNTTFKSILPNLAKKRNYAESEIKFKTSTSGSIIGNQQLQILPNQQTLVKKFRPIIPRQSSATQNGLKFSNYGVYLSNSGNNGNLVKNENTESASKNASGVSKPISYLKNVPKISNFCPIAPQKRQISSLSHQNRYANGLAQDSINISSISNTINSNEFHCISNSNSSSNHFLRLDSDHGGSSPSNDLKYSGLARPTLTVRRYISNPNGVFSSPQQSFGHLNKKKQLNSANNFLYNTRHRNSLSSKMLLVHHNNNRNSEDNGNQFQNIEPPPVLEAEGCISSDNNLSMFNSTSSNKSNLFKKNGHQRQSFLYNEKSNYLSQVSGSESSTSRNVNVQLVYQSQQQEHSHKQMQTQRNQTSYNYSNNSPPLQHQSSIVGQFIPQQSSYHTLKQQQGFHQKQQQQKLALSSITPLGFESNNKTKCVKDDCNNSQF